MEDNFSTDQRRGERFQDDSSISYLCAHYSYYIIKENQREPQACFPATRWSHLGVMGGQDTRSVLLMATLLHNLVFVAVTAEDPSSQR